MFIKQILSQHRNDFTAVMECEHCLSEFTNTCGYHDDYYYTVVIPGMYCNCCGLNRAGERQPKEDSNETLTKDSL